MIPLFKVFMSETARANVSRVLASGFIGQGPEVDLFEEELADVTPAPPILTNSCTSAIHMLLTYLGVGPGDEVITTPLTCIATNAPILAVGARPVWADVDPNTGLILPASVNKMITNRTKAIIAVDWTGKLADYVALKRLGPPVIQDAAHGPLRDEPREYLGDFICYSFGPIKHLTSGEGGAVVAFEEMEREEMRLMRWYGLDRRSSKDFRCAQDIECFGMKWNMTDVNAAIGRGNLPHLHWIVSEHRRNAKMLSQLITHRDVVVPDYDPLSNYWVFPLHIARGRRDEFKAWMEGDGVACSQVHARNDDHTAYRFPNGPLPYLTDFDQYQVNIPCGWWLSADDLSHVINAVNAFPVKP